MWQAFYFISGWAPSQHSRPSAKGPCLLSWFRGFGLGDEVICLVSLVFQYINASSKPCQIRVSIGYLKYMLLKYLNRSAICLNRPSLVNQQERWEADPARHEPVGRGAGSYLSLPLPLSSAHTRICWFIDRQDQPASKMWRQNWDTGQVASGLVSSGLLLEPCAPLRRCWNPCQSRRKRSRGTCPSAGARPLKSRVLFLCKFMKHFKKNQFILGTVTNEVTQDLNH